MARLSAYRFVQFMAEILLRLGIGTEGYHVEAGRRVHVTAKVLDSAGLTPLNGVEVGIEMPPPTVIWFGRTDSSGSIDETAIVGWSFDVANLRQPIKSPDMMVLFRLANFRDTRISFNLGALPLAAQVGQLELGSVTLSRI